MEGSSPQQVGDHLYWVPGALGARFPNCHSYLLDIGTSLVAFDPKCGRPQLQQACKGLKRDIKDIHDIICTHFHVDHTAENAFFKRKGARIWMHEADAPASESITEFVSRYGLETPQAEAEWRGFLEGFGVREVIIDNTFKDGDIVLGGFRVIHTPGHTPGHCCFYKDGVLIAGDVDLTVPWVGNKTSNAGDFIRSIEKLAKLDIRVLLPGHGQPAFESIRPKLEEFRQKLLRREDQLLRLLDAHPIPVEEIMLRVDEDKRKSKGLEEPLERSPYAKHFHKISVQNSLLHLKELGRVNVIQKEGRELWAK